MIREYRHEDFLPLQSLAGKKKASGSSISLVIPTLNEAKTVGYIIEKAKKELMDEVCLLDEIIVMDSSSSDATASIAKKAGATVYNVIEVLPQYDAPPGKGSALWKSQFVAKGDIIICVDADISNFQSHFVYGLAGPFLNDSEVIFAKAFYRRPLKLNSHTYENYGGRVTEILVRPFLCAFEPELAGIYQPLSGEYAFRRGPVQNLPFSSGYGVEIGMIFDIYRAFGLSRFVQVDMGIRCHRNRPTPELSRMAFGIIQTLLRKLEKEQVLSLKVPLRDIMLVRGANGSEEVQIREVELPSFAKVNSAEQKSRIRDNC